MLLMKQVQVVSIQLQGHGVDDYNASLKYNIGLICVVDNKGHMNNEALNYEGMFYKKLTTYN